MAKTEKHDHNKSNDYNIDRELQASGKSYTGMVGLGVQDASVQESMGPIADRTIEHLGASDTAIIQIRKLLLQSLKDFRDGKTPPGSGVTWSKKWSQSKSHATGAGTDMRNFGSVGPACS